MRECKKGHPRFRQRFNGNVLYVIGLHFIYDVFSVTTISASLVTTQNRTLQLVMNERMAY